MQQGERETKRGEREGRGESACENMVYWCSKQRERERERTKVRGERRVKKGEREEGNRNREEGKVKEIKRDDLRHIM